ncbi:hypothetical protein CAEBREN_30943, partial [Caenorhabditis brenneri]
CFKVTDFNGPYNHTEWFPPGPVDCEFLEAACWKNGEEVYGYIHSQVLPKPVKKVKKSKNLMKNEEKPDVYVLLIDSLSRTGGKRKTDRKWHESKWRACQLDWTDKDYCESIWMSTRTYFGILWMAGIPVLHSEDWSSQTVNTHPTCKGFKNQYSDHSFYPFTRIYDYESLKITQKHLDGKEFCREPHMAAMEYLEQFAEAYEDRPKFVWQWFVHLAHNHLAGANRGDPAWEAFLRKNAEKLDKSFVILMADHGFRFGPSSYYKTDIGKLERINPMFYISVPKKYRNNGMLEVLQANSKRLQTHYDTRATLLDILKYQPSSDFTNRTFFQISNEKGQSLIRRQPRTPRNCETLPILESFCLCGRELRTPEKSSLGSVDFACTPGAGKVTLLDLHQSATSSNTATSVYHIAVQTTGPAHFQTLITENRTRNTLDFGPVERLDLFGKTNECSEKISWSRLCLCKNR